MDKGTRITYRWEGAEITSNMTIFDKMQKVAEAALEEQEEQHSAIPPPSRKRLNTYSIASLTQRMAMVSGASTLAHRRIQARKLIRRYNRR